MKYLEWDSKFFGIDSYLFEDESDLDNLKKGFITAKIDINNQYLINKLLKKSFYFVNIEVVLKYKGELVEYNFDDVIEVKENKNLDYEKLGSVFKYSRFHLDINTKNKADLLWIEYLKNFKIDDKNKMFAIKLNNKIEGVFLVKENNLFFVSILKRNIGLGSKLIEFLKSKYNYLITETQLNNKAINFYIKNGFKIKESKMILHRWEKE